LPTRALRPAERETVLAHLHENRFRIVPQSLVCDVAPEAGTAGQGCPVVQSAPELRHRQSATRRSCTLLNNQREGFGSGSTSYQVSFLAATHPSLLPYGRIGDCFSVWRKNQYDHIRQSTEMRPPSRARTITRILEQTRIASHWMTWNLPKTAKKITIVMYHSVTPDPGPFTISPNAFLRQIQFIKEHYPVVRLTDLNSLLLDENDDKRKIVITFDDAYRHLLEFAYPKLKDLSLPCTIFVPTRFIGGRNEWDLRGKHAKPELLMTASELSQLVDEGLVDIGSHTVDHIRMRGLTPREMEFQAVQSKKGLEDLLQLSVDLFAYPYGQLRDFSEETHDVLRSAGYKLAVTTHWGTLNTYRDRMKLRRIFFDETDSTEDLRNKLEGKYDWFAAKERMGHLLFSLSRMPKTLRSRK
jgi:peptidoglycan/xylan/chitin deacetylase (PgdA/CDA1 family)